jgi:hypothetical protein
MEGMPTRQRFVSVADDGTVTVTRPADARQWEYIARALGDTAEAQRNAGAAGGMSNEGRIAQGLTREIRDTLRSAIPGYSDAVALGRDTIRRTQAVQSGYDLLRQMTTRERARELVGGLSRSEREAARQGVRSYIDDLMAQTQRALTDPNMDAREALRAWRQLSSRQAQDNLSALLGGPRARALMGEVDRIATDFELRAAVQMNSRTAIRQAVQGEAREITAPGALGVLMEGRPVDAGRRLVAAMTGRTEAARAAREAGIFAEISEALTRTRGADEAARIMRVVGRSIGSEPISRARAEYIARQLVGGLGGAAYQTGTQSLTSR